MRDAIRTHARELRALTGAALAAGLLTCAAPAREEPATVAELEALGYRVAQSRGGAFTAAWRPERGALPENELFALDLRLYKGADLTAPLAGAEVLVSAWMPEHGHGMARRPEAVEIAPGVYRVLGMLFHMEGFWQVFVDVVRDGAAERADFEVRL